MSITPAAPAPAAPAPAAPVAPADTAPEAPATPPMADPGKLGDPGKLALDAERKARRDAEKALQSATAKLKEIEDRDKTETQRIMDRAEAAEKAAAEATQRWHDAQKTTAITAAATAAQAIDTDAIVALIGPKVTIDPATGQPQGLDQAMSELQAGKPHLFRATPHGTRDAATSIPTTPLNSSALEGSLRAALGIR